MLRKWWHNLKIAIVVFIYSGKLVRNIYIVWSINKCNPPPQFRSAFSQDNKTKHLKSNLFLNILCNSSFVNLWTPNSKLRFNIVWSIQLKLQLITIKFRILFESVLLSSTKCTVPTAPSVATSLITVVPLPCYLPFFDYRSIARHKKSSIYFPQMLSSFHWDTCISACHSNSLSSCGLDDCKCTCRVTSCSLPLYLLQHLNYLVGLVSPLWYSLWFLWLLA